MRTLVLNAGYEPMQLVSWQRAICLVLSEKAEIISEYDERVRTVSQSFGLPSVVRLKRYVRIVRQFSLARCSRKNILIRDNYSCQYCGVKCSSATATVDHVIPRSKGGKTVWNNVVVACSPCNLKKGNMWLKNTDMRLLRQPKRPHWREMLGTPENEADDWLPYLKYTA